ncbi:hypothetical protein V1278_002257 [Bradyrhizobium sp. AZCC 1577]
MVFECFDGIHGACSVRSVDFWASGSFRGQGRKVNIWLGIQPDGMGAVRDDNASGSGSIPEKSVLARRDTGGLVEPGFGMATPTGTLHEVVKEPVMAPFSRIRAVSRFCAAWIRAQEVFSAMERRKCGVQIVQMRDRRELFTSISNAPRPEVKIALRLQLGDPHHAAAVGGNEARQQIFQRDILGFHAVATGGELDSSLGKLTDTPSIVLHRHVNAAAFAIDTAAETNFAAGVFGDNVIAIAAGIEIAYAVAIFETEAEGIIDGLVFRRVFGRHQKLHRADLLLRMPRQMVGVITTHKAGIRLLAERAVEHLPVECGGPGFIDAILGVAGIGSDEGGNGGNDPEIFHGRLGLNARHITLVAGGAGCVQTQVRDWP